MTNRRDTRNRKELRKNIRNTEIRENLEKLEKLDNDILELFKEVYKTSNEFALSVARLVVSDALDRMTK